MRKLFCTFSVGAAITLTSSPYAAFAADAPAPIPATVESTQVDQVQDTLQPGLAADAVRRYNKAVELVSKGETRAANALLTSLTRDYPSYYRALVLQAKTFEPLREKQLVLETYERAAKIQEDENIRDIEALYGLGELFHNRSELEKAEQVYLRAIALKDTNTKRENALTFNALGNLYLEMEKEEQGLQYIAIAANDYDSANAKSHLELRATKGKIDKQMQRADKAIKDEAKTGYDITTTLPLPDEDDSAASETPKDVAKPETGTVGAASANQ